MNGSQVEHRITRRTLSPCARWPFDDGRLMRRVEAMFNLESDFEMRKPVLVGESTVLLRSIPTGLSPGVNGPGDRLGHLEPARNAAKDAA